MWPGSYWEGGLSTARRHVRSCPPPLHLLSVISAAPLHCHNGAAYTVVRVADSLYVSFPEALPAPPLYSALTLMGMDEWPDTAPPVPIPSA